LQVLRIKRLQVSDGALREGLLYELLGRLQHEDARERSVEALARRYHTDLSQSGRVSDIAARLLQQCAKQWNLDSPLAESLLDWAARLHEIGLDIAHDGFQKHGAYIVENADMPGFPRNEQSVLAFMILNHRGSINLAARKSLPRRWREPATHLTVLLRLAVLLNRSRSTVPLPPIRFAAEGDRSTLTLPDSWLRKNPLSVADLERESRYLENAGYELAVAALPD
jgi:exopolyphosphatase/guanosine-5'-triphosphate,3'-diphosphate pyrophosphatase